MYKRKIDVNLCNHCCSGKAISISLHILSVFVAVGMQHAMGVCQALYCGLSCLTIFFHISP
jgi:hypothetical protein